MLTAPETDFAWESDGVEDVGEIVRPGAPMPILEALDRGHVVVAVRLRGFAGLIGHRTQPGLTFRNEIEDRLRVIACLTGRPFMTTTEDVSPMLSDSVMDQVRKAVGADPDDAVVLAWGPPEDASTAAEEILTRAGDALVGVPSETRQALGNGTTGFERILPGPERMYPDTDTPPFPVPDPWLVEIDSQLAERPWDREDRYLEQGLSQRAAKVLVASRWAGLFDALAPETEVGRRRLAAALERRLVHLWRQAGTCTLPEAERLRPLVQAVDAGTVRPEAFDAAFDRLVLEHDVQPAAILADFSGEADLDEVVAEVVALTPPRPPPSPEAHRRWAMGEAMRRVLGRVDPKDVASRLEQAFPEAS